MVTGYGGTYRGVVVDDADPLQQHRLGVVVPDVYGDGVSVWAVALRSSLSAVPVIGDVVSISFEQGDTDFPIWGPASDGEQNDDPSGAYVGRFRAVVVDNVDPLQENRLELIVAGVDSTPTWATASDDVRYGGIPEIDTEVWVEFEYGDPAYPRWVGIV
jgi:hypothetical protein